MNGEKFLGESIDIDPKKTTLSEMIEEAEKIGERGDDEKTVVIENLADEKVKVELRKEKVPRLGKDSEQ